MPKELDADVRIVREAINALCDLHAMRAAKYGEDDPRVRRLEELTVSLVRTMGLIPELAPVLHEALNAEDT